MNVRVVSWILGYFLKKFLTDLQCTDCLVYKGKHVLCWGVSPFFLKSSSNEKTASYQPLKVLCSLEGSAFLDMQKSLTITRGIEKPTTCIPPSTLLQNFLKILSTTPNFKSLQTPWKDWSLIKSFLLKQLISNVIKLNVFREVNPSNYENLIDRQGPISLFMDVREVCVCPPTRVY